MDEGKEESMKAFHDPFSTAGLFRDAFPIYRTPVLGRLLDGHASHLEDGVL